MKFILFDRVRKAGDNAEYFYRFLSQVHPEVEVKYILDSSSSDWGRLVKEKFNLIDFKNLTLVQEEIDSATYLCGAYLPCHALKKIDTDNINFIFLNHGCFYRKLEYLVNAKFDLMLAGNKLEYDTLLNLYKFPASKIALTGQPRQDSLINNNKKYTGPTNNILIQFWWRPWLNKDTFEKSTFYKNVSKFLDDKRITELAKKYNVNFLFKLHCEMEKYSNLFTKFKQIELVPNAELFEPLFIKSSLIITDMTSNVYEMGMINKPCIYFEPDWSDLSSALLKKQETILDVNKLGLGPVTMTIDKLFEELDKLLANNYLLAKTYLDRRKEQITFVDNPNCCARAFAAITKLPVKKKPVTKKKAIQKPIQKPVAKKEQKNDYYLYF